MLADSLMKSANPEYLLNAMKKDDVAIVDVYDSEKVTTEMIEEAGVDIPMEQLKQARKRPFRPYFITLTDDNSDWVKTNRKMSIEH